MSNELIERIDTFLDWRERTAEPTAGAMGFVRAIAKSIDQDKRQVHFVCSTGHVDRYGEIVEPEAYRASLDAFMLNPIFAAGHRYVGESGEPTILGQWVKVWISKDGLEGIAQFDDEDELAVRYWNHYRKGNLRAVSVGFIGNAWEMREMDIEGERRRIRVFTAADLLEISAVAIPANPHARVRSRGTNNEQHDDERLEAAVERAFDKRFHTGPGGLLTTLALDIAELVVAHVGQGDEDPYGDIPEPDEPGPGSEPDGQSQELKAALAEILGK
jgi:HK97 family phage prohead protease